MSKVGKQPIQLPSEVQLILEGSVLTVKGPKGSLTRTLPTEITTKVEEGKLFVVPPSPEPNRAERAQWGLWRALINNMVIGVSVGWSKSLEFQGVGYKAAVKPAKSGGTQDLELSLGYSHPILVPGPEGISFTVEKSTITVSGIDKELVGHVAAEIRSKRLPEPYKGSGIRYSDEVIRRKAGKKAAAAA